MNDKVPNKIQYAVDKIDRILFRTNKAIPIDDDKRVWGQDFFTGSNKERKLPPDQRPCWEVTLFMEAGNYSLNNALSPYAKRLMISANAFWEAGIQNVTAYQFYRDMGNSGNPNTADITKMWRALMDLNKTIATIINPREIERYQKRKVIKIKQARLLDFEPDVDINTETGKIKSFAIRMTIKPVLFRNAEDLRQIRRIDNRVLNPLNNTNDNLNIIFYLVEAILYRNSLNISPKILFEKLFRDLGLIGTEQKTRTQRTRAKTKIKQILEVYMNIGFIHGFEFTGVGVVIKRADSCKKEPAIRALETVTNALESVTKSLKTVTKSLETVTRNNATLLLPQRIEQEQNKE